MAIMIFEPVGFDALLQKIRMIVRYILGRSPKLFRSVRRLFPNPLLLDNALTLRVLTELCIFGPLLGGHGHFRRHGPIHLDVAAPAPEKAGWHTVVWIVRIITGIIFPAAVGREAMNTAVRHDVFRWLNAGGQDGVPELFDRIVKHWCSPQENSGKIVDKRAICGLSCSCLFRKVFRRLNRQPPMSAFSDPPESLSSSALSRECPASSRRQIQLIWRPRRSSRRANYSVGQKLHELLTNSSCSGSAA